MLRKAIVLSGLLLLVTLCGSAHEFDRAPSPKEDFPDLLRRSDEGSVEASKALANYYLDSERDIDKACKLLERAALKGDVSAQYNLGILLMARGGAENVDSAIGWFGLAAKLGDLDARGQLRMLGEAGDHHDTSPAMRTHTAAAQEKNAYAMEALLRYAQINDRRDEEFIWATELCIAYVNDSIRHRTYLLLLREIGSSMNAGQLLDLSKRFSGRELLGCAL